MPTLDNKRVNVHWVLSLISTIFLCSCTVGPKQLPVIADAPTTWPTPIPHALTMKKIRHRKWWLQFHDVILNALVEKTIINNADIKEAVNRIDRLKAQYAIRLGNALPKIQVNGLARHTHNETAELKILPYQGSNLPLDQNSAIEQLAFNLSWEIDLFGRLRQEKNVAKANLEANTNEQAAVQLSVISYVVKHYIELRSIQAKKQVALDAIDVDQELCTLLEKRYHAGVDNYAPLIRQQLLLEKGQADLHLIEAEIDRHMRSIELLTGQDLGSLSTVLATPQPIPLITKKVTIDLPAAAIQRRPDVAAAELRIFAANSDVGAAMANLLPHINVGALVGWQDQSLYNLLQTKGGFIQPVSTFALPLLNISAHKWVDLKKTQHVGRIIHYQKVVKQALSEIATYYSAYHYRGKHFHLYQRSEKESQLSLHLSESLYQSGLRDYISLLTEKKRSHEFRLAYINSQSSYSIALVELYKTLGGGI